MIIRIIILGGILQQHIAMWVLGWGDVQLTLHARFTLGFEFLLHSGCNSPGTCAPARQDLLDRTVLTRLRSACELQWSKHGPWLCSAVSCDWTESSLVLKQRLGSSVVVMMKRR